MNEKAEQAVNSFLNRLPADKVASKTPERNDSNKFFWMTNKAGRKVPVPEHLAAAKLAKGFKHTDGKIYSEDPADRVKPARQKSEKGQLADAMGLLADAIAGGQVKPEEVEQVAKTQTPDEKRFAELKEQKAWLKSDLKEEYSELKAKLNQ